MDSLFYQILVMMLVIYSIYLNYKINQINKNTKNSIKFGLDCVTELNKKESDLIKEHCINGIDSRMLVMKKMVENYFKEIKADLEKEK